MNQFSKLFLLALSSLFAICPLYGTSLVAEDAPAGEFKTLPGFEVELIHNVSSSGDGSWVALCVDDKGRIIASDQYGLLYRVTLDAGKAAEVEQLEINIGMAQGLLYAFDSLYININANARDRKGTEAQGPGIYRLTDTTGDDQFDKIEYIVPMSDKAGEHGPHALVLSPDGQKIYFCSGNQVDVPESAKSGPASRRWDEDHILGRMPDARGHMQGRLAPGGWICRMDPDGSNVELIATGFRNEYDIAFNQDGELFAYDADMEWDIGSPWYRPTRVNHVISSAEFGWRNGTGKWPDYYGDSFGAVVNIGPGSPTGITFGYGTNFPQPYQDALYICDWSYGAIHAVHMKPDGASYTGDFETFLTAAPMAVTDIIVHPDDKCLYFAVGGRRTASGLYRVKYNGDAADEEALAKRVETNFSSASGTDGEAARELRHRLESFHGRQDTAAIELAIGELGNQDRAIRFAARIALEHQPVEQWRTQALAVEEPLAIINSAYALARVGSEQDQAALINKLTALDFEDLPVATKLELLRALELVWLRLGPPDEAQREKAIEQLNAFFPGKNSLVNRELAAVLVYLNAPGIVQRCVEQLQLATAQEDQIHYAFCLREVDQGWSDDSRKAYFQWFFDAVSGRGGASFGGFLENIRKAALERLDEQQVAELGELAGPMPSPKDPLADLAPRQTVKEWTTEELFAKLQELNVQPNYEQGRQLTAIAQCFKCHRFNGLGGIQGPDLTAAGQRFSEKDLLVTIVEPNKEVSDQYQATQFLTDNGVVVGRVANLSGDRLQVVTNMLEPGDFTAVRVDEIIERRPSPISMMPAGLLDTFEPEEIAQIIAYLRSGGNPDHEVYH